MDEKIEIELLKKLGEETIYTAKGHFKACDIRRNLITTTIWVCAILNVLSLFFDCKVFAAIDLIGLIALLIWNEGEGKFYRAKHKEIAEKYLALHKEIRECYFMDNCNKSKIEELSKKVRDLDQTEKPEIPFMARYFAKRAIEKKDPETDNWFKN